MADLASSAVKINDTETASDAPTTENLLQKMGSSINACIDHVTAAASYSASASSGAYSVASGTATGWKQPTNLSITLTCTARPGIIMVYPDGSGTLNIQPNYQGTTTSATVRFKVDGAVVASFPYTADAVASTGPSCLYVPTATSHTFVCEVYHEAGQGDTYFENAKLSFVQV
jgi:hypothetical protein